MALLSGCFHAQINGGVAGAHIELTALDDSANVLYSTRSWDEKRMQRRRGGVSWDSFNEGQKIWWMGVIKIKQRRPRRDLFLLTASGGRDTDHNRDLHYDQQPAHVRGSWHAVVSGAQLREINYKVSLLTEAAYQWLLVQPHLTLEQESARAVKEELDRIARQMVSDINKDGVVDYADVLSWSTFFNRSDYLGDPRHLDELATAITLGFSPEIVSWAAQRVVTGSARPVQEPAGLWDYLTARVSY